MKFSFTILAEFNYESFNRESIQFYIVFRRRRWRKQSVFERKSPNRDSKQYYIEKFPSLSRSQSDVQNSHRGLVRNGYLREGGSLGRANTRVARNGHAVHRTESSKRSHHSKTSNDRRPKQFTTTTPFTVNFEEKTPIPRFYHTPFRSFRGTSKTWNPPQAYNVYMIEAADKRRDRIYPKMTSDIDGNFTFGHGKYNRSLLERYHQVPLDNVDSNSNKIVIDKSTLGLSVDDEDGTTLYLRWSPTQARRSKSVLDLQVVGESEDHQANTLPMTRKKTALSLHNPRYMDDSMVCIVIKLHLTRRS